MKAKTRNLKSYLFRRNFKLLNCCLRTFIIFGYFICAVQTQIFKFVNLSFYLHHISIFWLEHLYILPKLQRPGLKVHVFWCKTDIYSWNLSERVSLCCMKIYFQFRFLAIWSISASILSIIAWKAPKSTLSPSELAMFLKIDPRCFGPFDKFQDAKEISM